MSAGNDWNCWREYAARVICIPDWLTACPMMRSDGEMRQAPAAFDGKVAQCRILPSAARSLGQSVNATSTLLWHDVMAIAIRRANKRQTARFWPLCARRRRRELDSDLGRQDEHH